MVLPGPAMEMLRARDLITIADTDIGADSAIDALTDIGGNITSDVLRVGFAAVNIRALLDAPIHHSEKLVGLLSLDSSTPYQWSDHEQTTLREAADFLCVALRDADARRRLEDSELKFRLLAESSHAMIALLQKEGAVYLNPALMRLTGYSHDALMQTSLWDLLHPDDRDMIRSYRGRRLRDQTAPSSYETRILTKSGETRWLDIRASTFELGGKQAILVTGLDITDRKLSEQELLKSEARLRTLMDHLSDGVGLMIDGSIVYANPAMGRILGYSPDEFIGRAPAEFLELGDRERAVDRIVELDDGTLGDADEYQMVRRDGTSVSVLISSRQIEYEGRPALFSIMRDLTDQRQLEEQLRQT